MHDIETTQVSFAMFEQQWSETREVWNCTMARATIKNVKNDSSRQGNLIARLLPTSFAQSSSVQEVNGRVKIRSVLFSHVSLAQLEMAEMASSHNTQLSSTLRNKSGWHGARQPESAQSS